MVCGKPYIILFKVVKATHKFLWEIFTPITTILFRYHLYIIATCKTDMHVEVLRRYICVWWTHEFYFMRFVINISIAFFTHRYFFLARKSIITIARKLKINKISIRISSHSHIPVGKYHWWHCCSVLSSSNKKTV